MEPWPRTDATAERTDVSTSRHEADEQPSLDDLTARAPGQAVMDQTLALQSSAPPRSRLARIFGAHALTPEARSWYVEAIGERTTSRMLEALGPEFVVLHSVPVIDHDTDIDHIVIGPMGVVTVNTKRLREAKVWVAGDTVLVGGFRAGYVEAARAETERVREVLASLTLPVTPIRSVVAIVDASQVTVRESPADVDVMDARRLLWKLRRMPAVIGPDAVWAIAGALGSAATWSDTVPSSSPDDVVGRFDALHREVRVARAARLGWAAALCAGVAAAIVGWATVLPALATSW
jgi:hypothetical protein